MPRSVLPLAVLFALLAAGCSPTRIPPPPERFDTVVLTSDLAATPLYADALAAFLRNNWKLAPDSDTTEALTMRILPDGERVDAERPPIVVHIVVRPADTAADAAADTTQPDLADADYAGPDLSRRDLEDPARGQNEPDSLRRRIQPDSLSIGTAVLTATVDASRPDARDVLIRTARILASVEGTLSYRCSRAG